MTRRVLLGLLAAADVLLFGGLIAREEVARASGADVRLPVEGYDPRDLLSGRYVRFRLSAEREAEALAQALPPGPARFCLETRGDRARVVPESAGCQPSLLGERLAGGRVRFPVDRFYVDERRAREVAALEAGPDTFVVGRVDRAGRLHITDLVVAGRSFASK